MMRTFTVERVGRSLLACAIGLGFACQPIGGVTDGTLRGGVAFPNNGAGFVRLRPKEDTRFGTPSLVGALVRASAAVQERFPSSARLVVGDLSSRFGGRHPRHGSHRSGRDADLLYYARRSNRNPSTNRAWLAFDRLGLATRNRKVWVFDEERNWHLVRTLLSDPVARVQWIFCAHSVKSRLLQYAARHETSARIRHRASWVLQQPSTGNPHVDHFHVRVACSPVDRNAGCNDGPPWWPWLTDAARKTDSQALPPEDDASLVRWLLAEQDLDERRYVLR